MKMDALALVSVVALLPAPTLAQTTNTATGAIDDSSVIDQVVVTAQRRSERSVDVPISVTAIDADALSAANTEELADIAKLTPGLSFPRSGPFVQPTIRGVGTAILSSGSGSNVGIYTDGFYSTNPLNVDFQLLNIESIQVLKGPQGTLFGRNTTGGAILVTTAEPSHDTGAVAEASYGSYDAQGYQGYFTTGLSDNVAADIQALYRTGDGFARNIVTGSKDDGEYENWAIRAGLKIDASDSVSFLFRYSHQDTNDPTSSMSNAFVAPNGEPLSGGIGVPSSLIATAPNRIANTDEELFTLESDIFQLTSTFNLDFATLTSYTQYRRENAVSQLDLDQSGAKILLLSIPVKDRTFTQEFLLASEPGSRLQWTTGLFYMRFDDLWNPILGQLGGAPVWAPTAGSRSVSETIAGFADVTYQVTPKFFATVGARYGRDSVTDAWVLSGANGPLTQVDLPKLEDDRATPRVVLRYEPDDNSSVYTSYTQGYKAAIYDLGGNNPGAVDPEKLTSYEVGYKRSVSGFSLDVAAYYYDYEDLQISIYTGGTAQIINAANARVTGVEGQLRWDLTPSLQVSLGASYVDGEYQDFTNSPSFIRCTDPVLCGFGYGLFVNVPNDSSGFKMQNSPDFSGSLSVRYALPLGGGELSLSGNLYHTSKFYFDTSQQFAQDGYELLSLRAEWTDPSNRYTFAVYGDNVTDEEYRTMAQANATGIGAGWGAPATAGISIRAKF